MFTTFSISSLTLIRLSLTLTVIDVWLYLTQFLVLRLALSLLLSSWPSYLVLDPLCPWFWLRIHVIDEWLYLIISFQSLSLCALWPLICPWSSLFYLALDLEATVSLTLMIFTDRWLTLSHISLDWLTVTIRPWPSVLYLVLDPAVSTECHRRLLQQRQTIPRAIFAEDRRRCISHLHGQLPANYRRLRAGHWAHLAGRDLLHRGDVSLAVSKH